MKFEFDSQHNPKPLTFVLAKKDGTKLSALPAQHIKFNAEFNSCWDFNFSVYQINDGVTLDIWDEIVDFKLLWVKEFDLWFEIHVQTSDGNVCIKHITAKSLAQMELSQTNVYGLEVNTETDIEQDDYFPTVFYDETDKAHSLLHRVLSKTPHYSIISVPVSLRTIQRTFSFNGTSIYEALKEISEEIGCYFDFSIHSDENGKPKRAFQVYDLYSYCLICKKRGEFRKTCEKCGSEDIIEGYGKDTNIFVSTRNLTDEVVFETNEDSVKNCFKLESGDDLMDATIVSCNPNGSGYLWYIPDYLKKEMPEVLVSKIEAYDDLFAYYQNNHIVSLTSSYMSAYNALVSKYLTYNPKLVDIPASIVGFPALMNEYYNTIDFKLLLQSGLMPSAETIETSASEQAARLTAGRLSPTAVYSLTSASASTVESAVLAIAKAQVDYRYRVKVISGSYSDGVWKGSFAVTNYYDEEDTANSSVVSITIVDNYESYVSQMLDKSLSNTTDYATDIVTMFELHDAEFKAELKKYSLARLNAFYKSCEACLNILIEQGAANSETWSSSTDNLYNDLYTPYRNKQSYIQSEISLRESEIATIESIQDEIMAHRGQIQNALNFENYIGTDLWHTFITFRREDTYSNSNYISDGLDNAELFRRALEYIEVAKKELYKSANLQHSLSTTLKNLLVMREFDGLTDNFELGNYIHVECDGKIYDVRLLTFDIDFDNLTDLPVTFSDVREVGSDITDIKDVLDNSKSMATSYDNVVHQAEQGSSSRKQLDDWTTNGLALTQTKILDKAENQDYIFDEHGMLFRKHLPLSGTYSDEQLKIINSTIAITNDNWATVKTAVGSHYYIDPLTNELTYAYGINGEVLIGKIILGEQLGIYNSGATLQFNKNGLYITNGTNSFTLNPNTAENLLSIKSGVNDILTVSSRGLYVKGEIVATSGYIGGTSGWTIKSTYIYNGKSSLSDTTQGVYIGTDGISVGSGSAVFKVTNTGSITITGYATTAGLSDGTTTIDGACIKTGTIDANRIDVSGIIRVGGIATTSDIPYVPTNVSELTNDSGYIDADGATTITENYIKTSNVIAENLYINAGHIIGSLTIGQLPSSVATTSDIPYVPTNVSELTNDSGYKTYSGVVSIIDGRITADYIEALKINVKDAEIGNMTIIDKLYFGGDNTYYINANYNNNSWFIYTPKFRVDSTNAYFEGQLNAATGSFSGAITATSGNIAGWVIEYDSGLGMDVMRTQTGTWGRISWTTTGTDYRYTEGYIFQALTPYGFAYVLKETSSYSSTTVNVLSGLDILSATFTTNSSSGGIFEI